MRTKRSTLGIILFALINQHLKQESYALVMDLKMTPKVLLFEKKYLQKDGNKPLFKSQRQLAIAITENSTHYKNIKSLSTLLNKGFQEKNFKPLPSRLCEEIVGVVYQKFEDPFTKQLFNSEFQEAMRYWKEYTVMDTTHSRKSYYDYVSDAEEIHIFSRIPVTLYASEHPDAKEFTLQMFANFGADREFTTSYHFYVQDLGLAINFWHKLEQFLITDNKMDKKKATELLNALDNSSALTITLIEKTSQFVVPMVFMRRAAEQKDMDLFVTSFTDHVEIAHISDKETKAWHNEVFIPIIYSGNNRVINYEVTSNPAHLNSTIKSLANLVNKS